jgi:hypothetical protein
MVSMQWHWQDAHLFARNEKPHILIHPFDALVSAKRQI